MKTRISPNTFLENFALIKHFAREKKVYKTEQDFIDVGIDQDFLDWAMANKFISYWKKGECYFVNIYGPSQYYNSSGMNDLLEALSYFDFDF